LETESKSKPDGAEFHVEVTSVFRIISVRFTTCQTSMRMLRSILHGLTCDDAGGSAVCILYGLVERQKLIEMFISSELVDTGLIKVQELFPTQPKFQQLYARDTHALVLGPAKIGLEAAMALILNKLRHLGHAAETSRLAMIEQSEWKRRNRVSG
jgi:hypothetical protein